MKQNWTERNGLKLVFVVLLILVVVLGPVPLDGFVRVARAQDNLTEVIWDSSTTDFSFSCGKKYVVSGNVTTTGTGSNRGALDLGACDKSGEVTLHLNDGCTLNTKGINIHGWELTIEGSGTLLVNQGADDVYCRGINATNGTIIINGGNITTKGNGVYPGIGGDGATIRINGGTVNATGGGSSAGIGGGSDGGNNIWNYSSISITGGSVTATGGTIATGFGASAGIGGAKNGGGGPISITGGTVNATGGTSAVGGAAGIGSGYMGSVGNITISGNAEVTARGTTGTGTTGSSGAGIGSGYEGSVGDITISGGTLKSVTGGYGAAGIGDGAESTARGTITISGGTLTKVRGGFGAAGIGGGSSTPGGTINITGGTLVSISGGDYGAGIGGGGYGIGGNITISGTANVTAAGGISAAGIGGGDKSEGGTISISGGTVTATGGGDVTLISYAGAGIGGGGNAMAGSITISGGNVTSTGGAAKSGEKTGAGIGSGGNKSGGSITISGGTVTANAGAFTDDFYDSNHGAVAIGRADVTLTHAENASYPIITAKSKINAYSGSVTLKKDFAYQDTSNIVTTPIKNNSTIVPAETWTVIFDNNNGTGTMTAQKVFKGSGLTLPENTFTRTSYTFTGWNTAADGSGTSYADKASITPTDNMTLYAQWKHEHSFTYSLSADGKTITATCGHEVCPLTDHKASLTINAPTSLTYDGTEKAAAISGDTATLGSPDISYTKGGAAFDETPRNAGSYTAGITLTGVKTSVGENQSITASTAYTIVPKPVTITGLSASGKVYDGTTTAAVTGTAAINGKVGSDDLDIIPGSAAFADANVGESKTVTFSGWSLKGAAVDNYTFPAQPENAAANITARDITVTVANQSVELNGSIAEGTDQVSVTSGSLADGHNISAVTLTSSATDNITTTGTIILSSIVIRDGSENDVSGNYRITSVNGTLTVTKARAKVTTAPAANNRTYDGTTADLLTGGAADTSLEYSTDGTNFSDTVPLGKNADSYTVYYRAAADNNHEAGDVVMLTVTIGKAELTITAKDQTYVYNGEIQGPGDVVYEDPAEIAEKVTAVGLQGSDAITSIILDGQGKDAGTYDLVPSSAAISEVKDNYNITYVNGTLKITPFPVTLTANSGTETYDGTAKNVTGFTSSVTGLTFADSVTASGSGTNVGAYDVTFSGITVNTTKDTTGNYVVSGTTNGTLTITQASGLTAALEGSDYTYDGTAKAITNTPSTNAVGGTTTFTFSFEESGTYVTDLSSLTKTDAGTYTVYVKATNPNYSNTAVAASTLTITKAANPITVTSSASVRIGGNTVDLSGNVSKAEGNVTYAITGALDGCSIDENTGVLTSGSKAGTCTVTVTAAGNGNYEAGTAAITVTVTEKDTQTLVFAEQDVTKTWGDAAFTNSLSGSKTAVTYAVTDGTDVISAAADGTITILKTGTAVVTAYAEETMTVAGASASYTLTINKADLVITAPKPVEDLVYTGDALELITAGSVENGYGTLYYAVTNDLNEPSEDLYTTSIPTAINAGTYYVWYYVRGDENHKDSAAECCTVPVEPKSISGASVTLDKTQLTYSGSPQNVSVTGVTIDGLSLTADDYTVSGNTGTDKGDYTVTVTGTGNFKDSAETSWQILSKGMTVSAADVKVTYDGMPHGITVTLTEPTEGAVVKFGKTAGAYDLDASPTLTDVGSLTVYYQVTAANYSDYTGSAVVVVSRKAVSVTAKDQTINEGESIKTDIDWAEVSEVLSGHKLSSVTLTADTDNGKIIPSNALIADADGKDVSANYEITYSAGELKIIGKVIYAVTFKVVNGAWNDGNTADKTVTLTGYEGDTLKLAADQIPQVGSKPSAGYKAGSWDIVPGTDMTITADTTFTYTYEEKKTISAKVTFKVVNGAWDDGNTADKIVTLTGYEGDTLKLAAEQIPSVGSKPSAGYKAGGWDSVPGTDTAITSDTTFTYTYEKAEEQKPWKINVNIHNYTNIGAWGIPADVEQSKFTLNIQIVDRESDEEVSLAKGVIMPVNSGAGSAKIMLKDVAFDRKVENLSHVTHKIIVSGFPKSVGGNVLYPQKYLLSYQAWVSEDDLITISLMWDNGTSSKPEIIRIYALPEDEVGAYTILPDGTKEYLLFHTYDICMQYLGSDELCRGPERCFHKENAYENPFVKGGLIGVIR